MESCFLSVLIPVYNAAGYLAQTLDSLLRQDISDYEILCVNDGSTDASPEILEAYQRRQENIRVIHQENSGVAAARNTALRQATGEYIWFVDADDLVAPNCLGKLKQLARESGCQRLSFGGYTFTGSMTSQDWEDQKRGKLPCNVPWQDSVVWRNLLRRSFLTEKGLTFRYPDITHGEDGLYMFEVSREQPDTVDIPDILYFYRVHPGSAETAASLASRRKRLGSHLRVVEVLNGYYRADGGETAANRLMSFLWHSLYEIASMPNADASAYLAQLKAMGLFPWQIPAECTVRRTYLVDNAGAVGKILEFFCGHLHRPWGYYGIRFLHQVKNFIRKG